MARLVHELEVHQVELEMQNAELLQTRNQAEALLAQYTDLYDFAPTGYFNLTCDGTRSHSEATFTHSICPECRQKLYPELDAVLPGPTTPGTPAAKCLSGQP